MKDASTPHPTAQETIDEYVDSALPLLLRHIFNKHAKSYPTSAFSPCSHMNQLARMRQSNVKRTDRSGSGSFLSILNSSWLIPCHQIFSSHGSNGFRFATRTKCH